MSWLEREETKSKNPAKKFLEWKSDDGCFSYYDKELKKYLLEDGKTENEIKEGNLAIVKVELPFKFVILEHYHTVKGWNDASESGIYSNEVFSIGSKELNVKSFKGGEIANGLYKENKPKIKDAGGHYARSIYAVTNDLEIINISLKGSGVSSYSDFINEIGDQNFDKNWINVKEAKKMKKGKIDYSVPVFEKSTAIKDKSKLLPFAEELQEYITDYMNPDDTPNRKRSEVDKYEQQQEEKQDDLAF